MSMCRIRNSAAIGEPCRALVGRLARMTCVALLAIGGCGVTITGDPSGDGSVEDGNRDATVTSSVGKTRGEPNDSFSEPVVAVFDDDQVAKLEGTVTRSGDLDVYLLGALGEGDRLLVDATTPDSSLDVTMAVFDEKGRLVYQNDDRNAGAGDYDSAVDWVVRYDDDNYYLVVGGSPFAFRNQETGSYRVDIAVTGPVAVPEPVEQVVVLDFDGGEINSPSLGSKTIEAFDAGAISPSYEGQTEAMKTLIRDVVAQNYERFQVTVLTSDDQLPTGSCQISTVYFGGYNMTAFGIAEDVDQYNTDYCDDAIIYTESFSPAVFSATPSTEGMATAIGNVAAHEIGHLLGLSHVSDDRALMDDRSVADAFLDDQEFMEAPLSSDIMSIGTQNAPLLLYATVGPTELGMRELPEAFEELIRLLDEWR